MTTIVVYAIEKAGLGDDWLGLACIEGSGVLVTHSSSTLGWVQHDMGITSNWHHDTYDKFCPDGFELDYRGAISVKDFNSWGLEHLPLTEKKD